MSPVRPLLVRLGTLALGFAALATLVLAAPAALAEEAGPPGHVVIACETYGLDADGAVVTHSYQQQAPTLGEAVAALTAHRQARHDDAPECGRARVLWGSGGDSWVQTEAGTFHNGAPPQHTDSLREVAQSASAAGAP